MNKTNMERESHIVCIGASAGGLEAIERFFKSMPSDTGLAFVVVQHLSPDHKSMMVDILSKWTDMEVHQIREGMKVQGDTIFLIPPSKSLKLFNGKFVLAEKQPQKGLSLPIDIFMTSLAEDVGPKAIGVVLSGTGSDGTNGLRAIKDQLGLTIAQDEYSAAFDGMPRSAMASGAVDLVLTPEMMPEKILSYIQHPLGQQRTIATGVPQTSLSRIFSVIRENHKVDFSLYKPTTVLRRIERRIQICQCENVDAYYRYLLDHKSETELLYNELLIGVTSFFRDEDVFKSLRNKVIPEIIERLPESQSEIRIWCAACSSGEEAYSLTILFLEAIKDSGRDLRLKVFATDIDQKAVVRASQGEYPEGISQDVPEALLSKYFHHDEKGYKVSGALREPIVFAQHNLIKDPPFTNIDFVSCRNLLIYFLAPLQKRAMQTFNFSLVTGGTLLLGNSESIGEEIDLFEPGKNSLKIFQSRGIRRLAEPILSMQKSDEGSRLADRGHYAALTDSHDLSYSRMLEKYLDAVTSSFVDFAVLFNPSLEIIHTSGDTGVFLRYPSGRAKNDLAKMIHKSLSIPLTTSIHRLKKESHGRITTDVQVQSQGGLETIRMTTQLIEGKGGVGQIFCMWLQRQENPEHADTEIAAYDPNHAMLQRIADLEQSLMLNQETLQATVEELETSNEELQATNEELLASNEELQSTNEELQSVNEELFTVNAEYQEKIQDLTESNNDLDNFIHSMDVAVIYLDEHLDIRRFTDQARQMFNIRDSDIDRPFSELANKLRNIDIMSVINESNQYHRTTKVNVGCEEGNQYLLKVSPYNIAPGIYSGVVISMMSKSSLLGFEVLCA
ncbi:chemotaxis protein CheB [Mariprofundus sp. KV]|uniref:chemotaxis protein CheB n=1 Tax=Mariprofundus sp. KV TaxID=2608715 RepID=UPI0015A05C5D|nr:chemotaxis protein CheR [Mariprofundus sp. KV]